MGNHTLQRGSTGPAVERVQSHLRGLGFDPGPTDGAFGAKTQAAVVAFQRSRGLAADGVVGTKTIEAIVAQAPPQTQTVQTVQSVRGMVEKLQPWGTAECRKYLGVFGFRDIGHGEIEREEKWEAENLETVYIPQLARVPLYDPRGKPFGGRVRLHRLVAGQFLAAFEAIEALKLLPLILTFDGADCARYVRGGSSLSNHAWACAMDLNAGWNGLGKRPAETGQKGSVRELVPIFAAYGIGWGGFWSRPDGMHFGVGRLA